MPQSTIDALLDSPAMAIARAIRTKAASSTEVTQAFLARIRDRNPPINAAVQVADERALAEARGADAAVARGDALGPFHGVPFTVKDVFDTAGIVTAVGFPERAAYVPDVDAVTVARLRAAGAILLAKTNCPPGGGGGVTDNPVYGRTNNPYDLTHTVGGSSGGEAALQAAGCSPFGLGSDSGGSIRVPAHYCGVAGLKPTSGRVPNTGAYDQPGGLSDVRTQVGPLSRFVEDLSAVLAVIAGPDWRDSGVIPMPLGSEPEVVVAGLRVACFDDDGSSRTTPATQATVSATARYLADAGALVEQALPPLLDEIVPITHGYWHLAQAGAGEAEALYQRWDRYRTALLGFMRDFDVILCPVDRHPAPPHEEQDDERFAYTLSYSLTGWPCVVLRAGTSPAGMPIGVQVVARPWREDVAVAVARLIQTAFGGWRPPKA